MGMDWHSSGITTSVMGALKRGLNPRSRELGIYVCGGRGRHSRNTPDELRGVAERRGLDGEALVRHSRLTARVDNNAIGDGFQIYLHDFVVTRGGRVGGGAAGHERGQRDGAALSLAFGGGAQISPKSRTPAIVGEHQGDDSEPGGSPRPGRRKSGAAAIVRETAPETTLAEARKLAMPRHHDVRGGRCRTSSGWARFWRWRTSGSSADFAALLLLENLGPRTLQSLALDCGGGARRAQPLLGSGALLVRARREGRPSVPGAAEDLRRIDRGAAARRWMRQSWATAKSWRASHGWKDSAGRS